MSGDLRLVLVSGEPGAHHRVAEMLSKAGCEAQVEQVAPDQLPVRCSGESSAWDALLTEGAASSLAPMLANRTLLSALVDEYPDAVLLLDLEHPAPAAEVSFRVRLVNSQAAQLLGRSREELAGCILDESLNPFWNAGELAKLRRVASNGERLVEELRVREGVLGMPWIKRTCARVGDSLVVTLTDASASRGPRTQLDQFFSTSPALLCIVGLDGTVRRANCAFELVLEFSPEQLEHAPLAQTVHEEDLPRLLEAFVQLRHGRSTRGMELRHITRGGQTKSISWTMTPSLSEGVVYQVGQDVTERNAAVEERLRLEHELREIQKFEAIGTLAAGIAHDFSNLLTVVFGYLDLAKRDLPAEHPALKALEMIENVAGRATSVTNSLLTFSRKRAGEMRPMNLSTVMVGAINLLRRVVPASVELVTDIEQEPAVWVQGDEVQLQQVLINLTLNARDAMPKGGRLTVSLRRTALASGDGEEAAIVVADSGIGMDEQMMPRVFDPFFTTKPRGEGAGLGLAVVHGIIQGHGGRVEVHSRPGEGTRFVVYLPVIDEPRRQEPREARQDPMGHGRRILVVEDDAFVRSIVSSALADEGFDVLESGDGAEALRTFEDTGESLSLVVLDIDLPKLDGATVLDHMRQRRADMPIIIVTGNALDEDELDGGRPQQMTVFYKPFQVGTFIETVGRVLERCEKRESHT